MMRVSHKRTSGKNFTYLYCSNCGLVLAVIAGRVDVHFPNRGLEPGLCQECAGRLARERAAENCEVPF